MKEDLPKLKDMLQNIDLESFENSMDMDELAYRLKREGSMMWSNT
jgi:hypothetical protein